MTDESLNEDMLRELQQRTAQLPRDIMPAPEAWEGIKAQIDSEKKDGLLLPGRRQRPIWQRPVFLAAAALLLIAGSSLVTAVVLGGRAAADRGSAIASAMSPRASAPSNPSSSHPATFAEFAAIENDYIGTANSLAATIESGKTELTPETIAKLKESVRVIDAAILEARRALAADPANKTLIEMLSSSYGQKVDLLLRASAMGET